VSTAATGRPSFYRFLTSAGFAVVCSEVERNGGDVRDLVLVHVDTLTTLPTLPTWRRLCLARHAEACHTTLVTRTPCHVPALRLPSHDDLALSSHTLGLI
jgi:hypothetical protein